MARIRLPRHRHAAKRVLTDPGRLTNNQDQLHPVALPRRPNASGCGPASETGSPGASRGQPRSRNRSCGLPLSDTARLVIIGCSIWAAVLRTFAGFDRKRSGRHAWVFAAHLASSSAGPIALPCREYRAHGTVRCSAAPTGLDPIGRVARRLLSSATTGQLSRPNYDRGRLGGAWRGRNQRSG
jgi:hypothetical protein